MFKLLRRVSKNGFLSAPVRKKVLHFKLPPPKSGPQSGSARGGGLKVCLDTRLGWFRSLPVFPLAALVVQQFEVSLWRGYLANGQVDGEGVKAGHDGGGVMVGGCRPRREVGVVSGLGLRSKTHLAAFWDKLSQAVRIRLHGVHGRRIASARPRRMYSCHLIVDDCCLTGPAQDCLGVCSSQRAAASETPKKPVDHEDYRQY